MLPLSFTAEILGIHVKGRLTLSGEELEAMDSFQLGDAMSQVRGLHRSYIVVICRMCSDLLIGAIFFWRGVVQNLVVFFFNFLWKKKRKNKPNVHACKMAIFPSLHCLTCESSLILLFSHQASVFYRVSPKHKVAIVKVRLAITHFLLCSQSLCVFLSTMFIV